MAQSSGPLVIIDGHNTFIRNYVRSPYMNTNGERMGGATGMLISVRKLIADLGASNVLVVWDGEGGSQRRRSIHSEYKAGRTVRLNRADDDMAVSAEEQLANFKQQFDVAKEYLTMLGVPQVRADGVEADDLMAWVAAHMDHSNGVVIVSTDQDMLQLIRERTRSCTSENQEYHPDSSCAECSIVSEVRVWSPIRKVMYDRKTFISDYGVLPENFRLVKALTGDVSDNIEGVKGFGAKTVPKSFPFLIERRATAEEVITAAESLKGTLGKRLTEEKSKFLENLSLVDLSEPMLSATAARSAREALERDLGCKEVEFRMRVVRDGISFGGTNFIDPFRDLVARRRRMLAAHTKVETEESK